MAGNKFNTLFFTTCSPSALILGLSSPSFSSASVLLRPGLTARTLLERSLNGRERGPNFDNARHRAQNGGKKKIENTGVALAVHRWSRRCFSVGLTVASGSERWFSGDASVDRAAFCACGRWLDSKWAPGPFLPVFIAKFWSRSDTSIPTPNQSSSPQWIAASTPDTVPAIPCPLVKRLQPLHQSLCNV